MDCITQEIYCEKYSETLITHIQNFPRQALHASKIRFLQSKATVSLNLKQIFQKTCNLWSKRWN